MTGRSHSYLQNDYLQPTDSHPEIDLKQSPLVLLAKTCSAIGKDCSSSKIPTRKKVITSFAGLSANNDGLANKISSNHETARKEGNLNNSVASLSKPAYNTSDSKGCHLKSSPSKNDPLDLKLSNIQKRSKSPVAGTSPPVKKPRTSPHSLDRCLEPRKRVKHEGAVNDSTQHQQQHRSEPLNNSNIESHKPQQYPNRPRSSEEVITNSSKHDHRQKQAITSLYNGINRTNTFATASSSFAGHNTLGAPNQVMSMYDPFCVNCQVPHVAGTTCLDNLKNSQLGAPLFSLQNPAMSYYMQMMLAAARRDVSIPTNVPASTSANVEVTPHVCNWNVGSVSCGKMFATADELLAHLRSHTITPSSASTGAGNTVGSSVGYLMPSLDKLSNNPYAYIQQQALAAMSPAAHSQLAASLMVRSTSPLSRYGVNPYKQPNGIFNSLTSVPSLPVAAGVGPYCPPFGLYGQRFDSFSYH